MNSLPGNDHAAVSKFRTEGVHEWQAAEGETDATCIAAALDANTEATLALAFEQRTATLAALWAAPDEPGMELAGVNYGTLADQIKTRLGLNGDTK